MLQYRQKLPIDVMLRYMAWCNVKNWNRILHFWNLWVKSFQSVYRLSRSVDILEEALKMTFNMYFQWDHDTVPTYMHQWWRISYQSYLPITNYHPTIHWPHTSILHYYPPEIKLIMSLNYYYMLVITSFTKIIIDTAVLVLTLPTKMCMFAAFKSLKIMELFSYDPCYCEYIIYTLFGIDALKGPLRHSVQNR